MESFTVKTPTDLVDALKAVMPHVSHDATVPMLCMVRFRAVGNALTVDATDRYTIGRATVDVADTDGEPSFILSATAVKDVLKLASTHRVPLVVFTMGDDGWLTVSNYISEIRVHVETVTFPDLDRLVSAAIEAARVAEGTPTAGTPTSYTSSYLSRFDRAGGKHDFVTIWPTTGDRKPVLVTVGDRFVGVIMPVRHAPTLPVLS